MINRRELLKGSAAVAALVGFPASGVFASIPTHNKWGSIVLTSDMVVREFVRLMANDDRISFSERVVNGRLGDTFQRTLTYPQFTVAKQDGIDIQIPMRDMELKLDYFSDKYIGPIAEAMSFGLSKESQDKDIICMELGSQDSLMQSVATYDGVSARTSMMYDIRSDALFCRFDMIYGTAKRV